MNRRLPSIAHSNGSLGNLQADTAAIKERCRPSSRKDAAGTTSPCIGSSDTFEVDYRQTFLVSRLIDLSRQSV